MTLTLRQAVRHAVSEFTAAKAAMHESFGIDNAGDIAAAARQGGMPAKGMCANDLEYFTHGIGYTVVHPNSAQVHIDAGSTGDVFTAHDLEFYLADAYPQLDYDVAAIKEECYQLLTQGLLEAASAGTYLVPRLSDLETSHEAAKQGTTKCE